MPKRKSSKRASRISLFVIAAIIGVLGYVGYQKFFKNKHFNAITEIHNLPPGFISHGIDISHYQGDINWEQFNSSARDKVSFVYCKATEGISLVDKKWKENRNNLIEYQIPHGAYHFFIPEIDAIEQADHFLAHYDHQQNDLPPVLDVETEGVDDVTLLNGVRLWLHHVEAETGRRPIIYTSYNMYTSKFKDQLTEHKYWVANYNYKPVRFQDSAIIHWQYSDQGRVSGINADVDLNFSKIDFTIE